MEQLAPGYAMVPKTNDPATTGFRFGVGNSLIAALSTRRGSLYVRDFNRITLGGQINRWDFGTPPNVSKVVCSRAIGNELALDVGGLASPAELTLTLKKPGPGDLTQTLILRAPSGSRKKVLEVRLGNIELEKLASKGKGLARPLIGGDPDFEPLFGLTQASPPFAVPLFATGAVGHIEKPCASSTGQGFI